MSLNIVSVIDKKANKQKLTKEEIDFVVQGYIDGKVTDYQMSSWLMAVRLNGMSDQETIDYTNALLNSGEVIHTDKVWVDKHSTGGIGDKTSLVLGPVVAAMGMKIAKLSGRGLGFTGGTLDKLESIKGFDINISKEEFIKQVNKIGVGLISPIKTLAPADKKIYALRDVTGTVSSIPLIAASIMSKKIASGSKYIVIDLKVGDGGFMKDMKHAKELGRIMREIGRGLGREVFVLFTSMDQPLGNAIGNGIEVKEAIDTLKGNGPKDLKEVVIKIASEQYAKSKKVKLSAAIKLANDVLANGKAYAKFIEWMEAQGASKKSIENQDYWQPEIRTLIKAQQDGYIQIKNNEQFGWLAIELGAGRKLLTDKLNYNSGFIVRVKNGDKVAKYDTIIEVYSEAKPTEEFLNKVSSLITISKIKPKNSKLILGELKW